MNLILQGLLWMWAPPLNPNLIYQPIMNLNSCQNPLNQSNHVNPIAIIQTRFGQWNATHLLIVREHKTENEDKQNKTGSNVWDKKKKNRLNLAMAPSSGSRNASSRNADLAKKKKRTRSWNLHHETCRFWGVGRGGVKKALTETPRTQN